mmetsp:Transcript_23331/g.46827  ORF Transcript_23331/g.46827 Transcript_23331/m.46827 type:complete len:216 (-) Transcript_23331:325-972(-)
MKSIKSVLSHGIQSVLSHEVECVVRSGPRPHRVGRPLRWPSSIHSRSDAESGRVPLAERLKVCSSTVSACWHFLDACCADVSSPAPISATPQKRNGEEVEEDEDEEEEEEEGMLKSIMQSSSQLCASAVSPLAAGHCAATAGRSCSTWDSSLRRSARVMRSDVHCQARRWMLCSALCSSSSPCVDSGSDPSCRRFIPGSSRYSAPSVFTSCSSCS